jgi:hypothetical protein
MPIVVVHTEAHVRLSTFDSPTSKRNVGLESIVSHRILNKNPSWTSTLARCAGCALRIPTTPSMHHFDTLRAFAAMFIWNTIPTTRPQLFEEPSHPSMVNITELTKR